MLTDTERTKLAHWMGWEPERQRFWFRPGEGPRIKRFTAWKDTWLNPPTGNDMLMLLERARELGLDPHLWCHEKLWSALVGSSFGWNREDAGDAVASAVLAMLEDSND